MVLLLGELGAGLLRDRRFAAEVNLQRLAVFLRDVGCCRRERKLNPLFLKRLHDLQVQLSTGFGSPSLNIFHLFIRSASLQGSGRLFSPLDFGHVRHFVVPRHAAHPSRFANNGLEQQRQATVGCGSGPCVVGASAHAKTQPINDNKQQRGIYVKHITIVWDCLP